MLTGKRICYPRAQNTYRARTRKQQKKEEEERDGGKGTKGRAQKHRRNKGECKKARDEEKAVHECTQGHLG